MKSKLGGLSFTLRPDEHLHIKGTDYVIKNGSPLTVRLHLFLKSKYDAIVNVEPEKQKDQK
jgi:hypothetical protein